MIKVWRHLVALTKKHLFFFTGVWWITLLQLLSPVIFIGLLKLMDQIPRYNRYNPYIPFPTSKWQLTLVLHQPTFHIDQKIPLCTPYVGDCISLRYSCLRSDKPKVDKIVNFVQLENEWPSNTIQYHDNATEMLEFLLNNPNRTQNAIIFHFMANQTTKYEILMNASMTTNRLLQPLKYPDYRLELQILVDRAIISMNSPRNFTTDVNWKLYPQIGLNTLTGESGITERYGVAFYFAGLMMNFIILLYNVCSEKDQKLRQALKVIGMSDFAYIASWFLFSSAISIMTILVLIAIGYAFQLTFFYYCDVSVSFVLFFSLSLALNAFALFFSVFIEKAHKSLNLGLGLLIFGMILVVVLGDSTVRGAVLDPQVVPTWSLYLLSLFPPLNMAKAVADITAYISYASDPTPQVALRRYTISSLYAEIFVKKKSFFGGDKYRYISVPPTIDCIIALLVETVLYLILTWYLDHVLVSSHSRGDSWLFFLPRIYRKTQHDPEALNLIAKDGCYVHDVSKTYKRGFFECVHSLKGVTFSCDSRSIVGILGHNGAGKSTLLNILTGLATKDRGTVMLCGYSIDDEMDKIRELIGYCPQHDILWGELTPIHHFELFGRLKGLNSLEIQAEAVRLLASVKLDRVAHKPAKTFSGGMKRRLSIALAFIGSPSIVYLDEATTGLDPIVKRDIWKFIYEHKKDMLILMTTHDMEEANTLSDTTIIFGKGDVLVAENSISLKSRSNRYQITVECGPAVLEDLISGYSVENYQSYYVQSTEFSKFEFVPGSKLEVLEFARHLESKVKVVSISQCNVESVFMKMTNDIIDA